MSKHEDQDQAERAETYADLDATIDEMTQWDTQYKQRVELRRKQKEAQCSNG